MISERDTGLMEMFHRIFEFFLRVRTGYGSEHMTAYGYKKKQYPYPTLI